MISTTVGAAKAKETAQDRQKTTAAPRASRSEVRPGEKPVPEALWSVQDAGAYLDLSVSAVYKMTARRARVPIPHIRIGGKLRFRRTEIDRWLGLLTVSNLDVLERVRSRAKRVAHGDNQ